MDLRRVEDFQLSHGLVMAVPNSCSNPGDLSYTETSFRLHAVFSKLRLPIIFESSLELGSVLCTLTRSKERVNYT